MPKKFKMNSKPPYLFPVPNLNFTSGRYLPPSKNVAAQRLFQRTDPYARNLPFGIQQALATGVLAGTPTPLSLAYRYGARPFAIGGAVEVEDKEAKKAAKKARKATPVAATEPPAQPVQALPQFPPTAPIAVTQPVATTQPIVVPAQPTFPEVNPNPQVTNAARLLYPALAGNPFISQEGLARLQRGYAPLENEILPAFYRYTSPVIQAALSGLRRSVGLRPEEQQFMAAAFRPRGLF